MAELDPRHEEGGPQICKTSFGVKCKLLWIWENKSQLSEQELKKKLKPYNIWTNKYLLQFPYYNKASLKDLAWNMEQWDFHYFVIHDQLKHFTLVASRDDSDKFQREPLKALNQFRMIVENSMNECSLPDLEQNHQIIWIEALKNIKKKMMARNYDLWYLNTICNAPLDYKFQNPLDIVDGMLKRALEAQAGNSNSSASATGPDLSIVTSTSTLRLTQSNPLDDQPPSYSSITNDEV